MSEFKFWVDDEKKNRLRFGLTKRKTKYGWADFTSEVKITVCDQGKFIDEPYAFVKGTYKYLAIGNHQTMRILNIDARRYKIHE